MIIRRQFIRFAVIGVVSNLTLYALYIVLTWLGMGPKTAMSLLYITGSVGTYFFNHRWTFQMGNYDSGKLARYLAVYLSGYIINFGMLFIFVDSLGKPHQLVQGIMIIILACLTFLLLKYWVFHEKRCKSSNAI